MTARIVFVAGFLLLSSCTESGGGSRGRSQASVKTADNNKKDKNGPHGPSGGCNSKIAPRYGSNNPAAGVALTKEDSGVQASCAPLTADGGVDIKPAPVVEGKLELVEATEQHASAIPTEYQDLVAEVITKVLKPIVGETVAESVGDLVGFASNGLGVGVSASLGAGAGVSVAPSFSLETIYHRPRGAGEIGLFCAPGATVGGGVGVSASAGYYFIKTLGCKESVNYEGGFLTFPLSFGNYSVNSSIGIDATRLVEFLEYATKGVWSADLTAAKINSEMEKFNSTITDRARQSESALEILSLTVYLVLVNGAVQGSSLVKAVVHQDGGAAQNAVAFGAIRQLPGIIEGLLRSALSFEKFKSRAYPSFKTIFSNLLAKINAEEYPFNHAMLSKLVEGMGGCDAIAFGEQASTKSVSLGAISSAISYSYTVNPEFLGFDALPGTPAYEEQKDKKIILQISSFLDFLDPANYAKLAETLGKNLYNDAIVPINDHVISPVKDHVIDPVIDLGGQVGGGIGKVGGSVGGAIVDVGGDAVDGAGDVVDSFFLAQQDERLRLLGVGDDIAAYTGLDNFGPLRFLSRLTNLADYNFVYQHCLSPGIEHGAKVGTALKSFFSNSAPTIP